METVGRNRESVGSSADQNITSPKVEGLISLQRFLRILFEYIEMELFYQVWNLTNEG